MVNQATDFNLLDESWIPVLWNTGKVNRVSIKTVISEAGNIRDIAASNPMDRFAVIRFLLALLYWCRGNPPDNFDATSLTAFPEEWFTKMEENKECFYLLGEGKRFYQSHPVNPKKDDLEQGVVRLIHEIPFGDDKWHFKHSTDKISGLCPACCSLGLLRLPLFTTGEGRGWHQGINGTPPIYLIRVGKTLLETICINWISHERVDDPAWIQPENKVPLTGDISLLAGLTMLPRRIWFHNLFENGTCIVCGSDGIIKTCEYQDGGSVRSERWEDPHVIYVAETKDKARKSIIANDLMKASSLEKSWSWFITDRPWLDLISAIVNNDKRRSIIKPFSLLTVGFGTNKAKNVDVWERVLYIPGIPVLKTARHSIEQWKDQGVQIPREFRYANEESRKRKHTEIASSFISMRPHVENEISGRIDELLENGTEAWQEAAKKWDSLLDATAVSLSPGYTTNALEKQQRIRNSRPVINPPAPENKNVESDRQGGDDYEHE